MHGFLQRVWGFGVSEGFYTGYKDINTKFLERVILGYIYMYVQRDIELEDLGL